jgi:membrane associated rhomboid family serine protease
MEEQKMCIGNRMSKPASLIPLAMAFLGIGILWPNFFHPATSLGKDWSDGLRGLMFGVSLGINLSAAWLAGRQRRCGGSRRAAHDGDLRDTGNTNINGESVSG